MWRNGEEQPPNPVEVNSKVKGRHHPSLRGLCGRRRPRRNGGRQWRNQIRSLEFSSLSGDEPEKNGWGRSAALWSDAPALWRKGDWRGFVPDCVLHARRKKMSKKSNYLSFLWLSLFLSWKNVIIHMYERGLYK